MNPTDAAELERAIAGLREQGIDSASIDNLVEGAKALVDLSDADFQAALRNWKDVSRTGYYHDFVPILFTSLADACQDTARRQRLHKAAKELSLTRAALPTIENLDANELRCPRCGAEDVDNSRRWTPQSGDTGDWVAFVCRKCGHEESAMGATPAVGFAWERHTLRPVENTPELEQSIAGLQARRIDVSGIIRWAKAIIDVPDVTFEAAMRAWQEEVSAEHYGDFGALLLQSLADACPETKRKQRLQKAAQEFAHRRTTRAPLPATEKAAPTDVIARIERAEQFARAGRDEDALRELEPEVHNAAVRRAVAMLPPRLHTTAQSTGLYRDVAPVLASATVRWVADGIAVDTTYSTDFAASPVALLARCGSQKRMVVLDPDTGALRCEWPYADALLHRDEPALLGDVALILSNPEVGKPDVKARDLGTGELLWSWRPEGNLMPEGLVAGLLIELQEKAIHARPFRDPRVAPAEAHQGWSQGRDWFKPVKTSGKDAVVLHAQLGVTEDAVLQYIADDNRGQVLVRALHPQVGSELWRTKIAPEGRNWIGGENQWEHWDNGVTANLVTDRSGLVFGVEDGEWQDGAHVLAFAATGEPLWRAWNLGARPIALAADGVYVTRTRDYPSRTLILLDRAGGAQRWEHRLVLDSNRFLAVRGAFYALTPPSTLEVRSAEDASLIASIALPLAIHVRQEDSYCHASLAASNGRVFVAAGNKVVCVGEKRESRSHVSYGVPEPEDETAAAESLAAHTAPQSLPQTALSEQAGTLPLPRTLEGKGGAVNTVAFSPDGKVLASGSNDKTVKLWDLATGNVIKSLVGHGDWIQAVAFSPDGKVLASGSDDRTARLWDVASGKNFATFSGHNDEVMCIAFSPHGEFLATGGDDNKVRLWDTSTGQEIRALSGHNNRVNAVSFSPDGKVLASASGDSTVKLWDVATGKEIKTLAVPGQKFKSVAFSPDGTLLASASDDKTIKVWDVASGRQIGTLVGHRLEVHSASFSPDGTMLASGSSDADIKLWQIPSGKEVRTLGGHGSQVNSVSFSPDGRMLASGSKDYAIMLWEVKAEAG